MKTIRLSLPFFLLTAFALWVTVPAGEPAAKGESKKDAKKDDCKTKFAGVNNCKLCHNDPETGEQVAKWKKSKHAEAFKTLSSPKAKEVAKKQGVEDPAKDPKCVRCHVTGFDCPKDVRAKIKDTDGVSCEVCHGAGADYAKEDIMKDKKASIAKGLVDPDEKVCVKCHNKENPTQKEPFDFKAMAKKIAHPNPKAKKD
jgi:hypothetical protein